MKKRVRKDRIRYRYFPMAALFCALLSLGWLSLQCALPEHLYVAADAAEGAENKAPPGIASGLVEAKAVLPAAASAASDIPQENLHVTGNSYTLEYSLLGLVPIKNIQVDVVERTSVRVGGMPVGIYMKTEGVLIVGTGEVCGADGTAQIPSQDVVRSGDYILAVNEIPVARKEEVAAEIAGAVGGQVQLTVLRDGAQTQLTVPVVQTAGDGCKAGIWIRDDAQGIGTLTYLKEDGSFGALGHGISDIDTSTLLNLSSGALYRARIQSVVKGTDGSPGELAGSIRYSDGELLGRIEENTGTGIFGKFTADTAEYAGKTMEVAYRQEIEEGPATILSAVDGEVKEYDIEIEKFSLNSRDANKSMVIRVTDPGLLSLTGGIVQGMSGSPILQNGRIVGAVTHVFVNDPTKGYGIFIETMLEQKNS